MWGLVVLSVAALEAPSWRTHTDVRDVVVQRAIQTQLYFAASTRDLPRANWLAKFLDHEHLGSSNKAAVAAMMGEGGVGEGGDPFTYRARLDGLRLRYDEYLRALVDAPPETIKVEIAPSMARLSSWERRNPYLMKQKMQSFFYDETIEPRRLASLLVSTAQAITQAWALSLRQAAEADDTFVWCNRFKALMDGSQKPVDFHDNIDVDDNLPLNDHDVRALERWCTLRAADELLMDLSAEMDGPHDDDDIVPAFDRSLLFGTQSRIDRESADYTDEVGPRGKLWASAAFTFFSSWAEEWMPRIVRGANDEERAEIPKVKPGHPLPYSYRGPGKGEADASDALERLWMSKRPLSLAGGHLVDPTQLCTNLRAYRARAAYDAITTLDAFHDQLPSFVK